MNNKQPIFIEANQKNIWQKINEIAGRKFIHGTFFLERYDFFKVYGRDPKAFCQA